MITQALFILIGAVSLFVLFMLFLLLSDFINRNKTVAMRKFEMLLMEQWKEAHKDAGLRNDHLESIACALEALERKMLP